MIVIDIQFFFINGKMEAKEIGFLNVKNGKSHTFLIKSDTHIRNLSANDQRNAFWLTKNFHGLHFMSGLSELSDVKKTLADQIACENIYVNGSSKKNWLLEEFDQKKMNFEVFDISDQNGEGVLPNISIKKLKRNLNYMYTTCIFHNNNNSKFYCAQQNTFFINHLLSNK